MSILIQAIGEDWFTANTLCEIIGLSSKSSFIRNYVRPAMDCGLVVLEISGKPNAPTQRYGLTLKGKALYYERYNDPQIVQVDPQKDAVVDAIKNNNRISMEVPKKA